MEAMLVNHRRMNLHQKITYEKQFKRQKKCTIKPTLDINNEYD